ncbi:hypothetical protein A5886_001220 [Enterococcus sp. 8G7_MSG3316]|uniref:Homoserine dehydrogenase n=1 Tax=Candidatus Enterococcus testudinis TaxID=1834191 RepID=A0A242A6A4_9ENTE|nr:homoserine dehydrogenase [Enterococcus sp. 8G7_MSG3316]OTN76143.1 hypothetical protein A5886_001220 [Enterococcus sp. 8G7_MSG3316]
MGKQLNVGLLGMGVVGSGVCQVLSEQRAAIKARTGVEITITRALASPYEDKSAIADKYGFSLTATVEEIFADPEIDVIVELIGKINPAKEFILAALAHKKHVVTANKDLIATHGPELLAAAEKAGVSLYFEASVGGGIPILRTLSTHYLPDTITDIFGIVNGTTNYMLTKMVAEGLTYEEALSEAQEKGFAESDPTNDVDGIDAAYKMVILTKFAFGMTIDLADIDIKGIRGLSIEDIQQAAAFGYDVKLIGAAQKNTAGAVAVSVGPVLVPQSHALASIKSEFNGVFIKSTGIGQSMVYGPGAGSRPTATSVVADLTELAKHRADGIVAPFIQFDAPAHLAAATERVDRYYLSCSSDIDLSETIAEVIDPTVPPQQNSNGSSAYLTKPITQQFVEERFGNSAGIQMMKVMEEF